MEIVQKNFSTHISTLLSAVAKVKISETDFNDCLGKNKTKKKTNPSPSPMRNAFPLDFIFPLA